MSLVPVSSDMKLLFADKVSGLDWVVAGSVDNIDGVIFLIVNSNGAVQCRRLNCKVV